MQFIQPNGYQTPYGQPPYYAYYTPTPNQCNGYPEIIGEGNITSMVSPDGTTQFLFLPTAQWWRPFPPNRMNNPCVNDLGAWIVRSIYNPLPPAMSAQPYQTTCNDQFLRPSASAFGLNTQPGFQLKFHNDNCTSTSDLHHFTPKQCNLFQKPKEYAAVQVEMPPATNTVCHYGFICNQPCNPVAQCSCATKNNVKQNIQSEMSIARKSSEKITCKCAKKVKTRPIKCLCVTSNSDMSIEESKSDIIYDKAYKHSETRNKTRKQKIPKQKSSSVNCKRAASDKFVATCTDQATATRAEKCQRTQTDCISMSLGYSSPDGQVKSDDNKQGDTTEPQRPESPARKNNNIERTSQHIATADRCENGCRFGNCNCKKYTTELWMPATPTSKKDIMTEGLCDNGRCSDCNSEAEYGK